MTDYEAMLVLKKYISKFNPGEEIKNALEIAKSALSKRICKKPIKESDKYSDVIIHYYCPECGRYFGSRGIHNVITFKKEIYCQGNNCGQAINWNE